MRQRMNHVGTHVKVKLVLYGMKDHYNIKHRQLEYSLVYKVDDEKNTALVSAIRVMSTKLQKAGSIKESPSPSDPPVWKGCFT